MGYWEQIGEAQVMQQGPPRRDWPELIAWPTTIAYWTVLGLGVCRMGGAF